MVLRERQVEVEYDFVLVWQYRGLLKAGSHDVLQDMRVKVLFVMLKGLVEDPVERSLKSHPHYLPARVDLFSCLLKKFFYRVFDRLIFWLLCLSLRHFSVPARVLRLEGGLIRVWDSNRHAGSYWGRIVDIGHVVVLPLKIQQLRPELSRLLQNLLCNGLLDNLKAIVSFFVWSDDRFAFNFNVYLHITQLCSLVDELIFLFLVTRPNVQETYGFFFFRNVSDERFYVFYLILLSVQLHQITV